MPENSVLGKEGLEYYDGKSKERLRTELNKKVDKISGKGLSTNDYTTAEKNKLDGIAAGANKTIVDSELSSASTNPVQNKVVNDALSGKVPTTRKINSKALSADITLSASDVGLGNVGNFKAVSTVASQGLTDTEKSNARANIGAASASHTHDDRYYTESEIDSKLSGKANSSHTHTIANITKLQSTLDGKAASNHTHSQYLTSHQDISGKLDNSANGADSLLSKITTSWTATPTDDTYFIRQDTAGANTFGRVKFSTLWSYIKSKADKVYAALTHTHTKSQITDFPTSMPANGGNASTVNNHTVNSDVPANAKFTDTTYSSKAAASGGKDVSLVTTGEKAIWNAKTSNTGTITGIKMNGASKGTLGVVDLGTVLTGGKQSTTSTADGGSNVYTFSDGSTITVKNGSKGATGAAGSAGAAGKNGTNGTSAVWFTGTAVTGTSTSAISVSVSGSKAGDMYLNTSTSNVYRASAANSWIYVCNIKGATGKQGAAGAAGTAGKNGSDGVSCTHSWNGTTLTVTSASGTSSANLKGAAGANGVTPTIKAAAGSNIGSVGTPSVTASTSGTTTTFTFNNLKGAKGDKGDNATTTAVSTQSANGLMSASDKKKLDGIASGARVASVTVYQSSEPSNQLVNDSWLQGY